MRVLFTAAVLSGALVAPAHAYLDPGSGSLIIQGIIGAIAIAGASVSVYWRKLRAAAAKLFNSKTART